MFGNSLFALQARKRRAWFVFPLAVFLHLVAFATFVGAQYWAVAELPEPDLAAVFYVSLPPPPPPAAPPAGRPAAREQTVAPRPPQPIAQPEERPQETPDPSPEPAASEIPVGEETVGSDAPGIPGGTDPNGSPDGVPGALPGGPAGSILPAAVAEDQPIPVGGAVLKPEIIPGTRVKPLYTEAARRARLTGTVVLEAIIDARGNVTAVRVVKPLSLGLDQEAVRAVQQWKFRPATLHGRPVAVYLHLTVTYEAH